jgi:DNA-binding beta-propeller fold protein YncE
VDNSQIDTINLGAGSFNPQQLLVSTDESKAYIVAADLSSVLVFDIRNQTTSAIALAGGALPVQATLTSDGGLLYVAANDGLVHVLDTLTGLDVQQIDFPQGLCSSASGDNTFTCKPNLVAARR